MEYDDVKRFIGKHDKFIITGHETPDGDAVGSEIALNKVLRLLGKESIIINADAMARKYSFIDPDKEVHSLEEECHVPENLGDWAVFIVDTGDIHNIGEIRETILQKSAGFFIIDHHESDEHIVKSNLIEESASSTCEILYDFFSQMNIAIPLDVAKALFVGIVYDTGSFVYPKTTGKTFHIAHNLVKIGVKPNEVYSHIYESNSISSLLLQSRIMSTLELRFENRVSFLTMRKEDILACGAIYEEADTFINIPLKCEDIHISVFFKENTEGVLRCSLRSKGEINVAVIAQRYGGGGHKTAAGFKSTFPLEKLKKKLLKSLKKTLDLSGSQ